MIIVYLKFGCWREFGCYFLNGFSFGFWYKDDDSNNEDDHQKEEDEESVWICCFLKIFMILS